MTIGRIKTNRKSRLEITPLVAYAAGIPWNRQMYSYAQVESVLADVFGVPPENRGSLRGRIKHFQTLGIAPASPGKGRKIAYNDVDVFRWAICLEFAEFGIDPTVIKSLIAYFWPLIDLSLEGGSGVPHEYLIFYPELAFNFHRGSSETRRGRMPYFFASNARELSESVGRNVEPGDLYDRRLAVIHMGFLWREMTRLLEASSSAQ